MRFGHWWAELSRSSGDRLARIRLRRGWRKLQDTGMGVVFQDLRGGGYGPMTPKDVSDLLAESACWARRLRVWDCFDLNHGFNANYKSSGRRNVLIQQGNPQRHIWPLSPPMSVFVYLTYLCILIPYFLVAASLACRSFLKKTVFFYNVSAIMVRILDFQLGGLLSWKSNIYNFTCTFI